MKKEKLQLKKKEGENTPLGLTDLANSLRNPPVVKESIEQKDVKEGIEKEEREVLKDTALEKILEKIDSKKYECTEVVYIDKEIKQVFSLLKSKGKIQTSSLVSYVLEAFLEQYRNDINAVIARSNRFLD